MIPFGFVYLKDIDSSIPQDIKYFTNDNFMGRPIDGYHAGECVLTTEAATALSELQQVLLQKSLSLKVFDGYRPQSAVNDFIIWSEDVADQKMKSIYFPNVNKADFFDLGYTAKKSSHTRGSTVDVTLMRIEDDNLIELDMGTPFDFMDELSHTMNQAISEQAMNNRLLLRHSMQAIGFEPYDKEWWHFTLKNEPYPDSYFDFPIA